MALAAPRGAWRGVSDPWGTERQVVENIVRVVNSMAPAANLSLEKGVVPALPTTGLSAGSTRTLTAAQGGTPIFLDTATGSVVTLPTSTGSQVEYEFITTVLRTSNSHIVKVGNATDVMSGALTVVDNADGTSTMFGTTGATTTRSDTITLNGTTTGSVQIGERFFVKDVKAGWWAVRGVVIGTGSEATPFSATV